MLDIIGYFFNLIIISVCSMILILLLIYQRKAKQGQELAWNPMLFANARFVPESTPAPFDLHGGPKEPVGSPTRRSYGPDLV